MQKKIMILGGGQAQIELIKTAKELGLYTIVVGIDGDYPGYEYADKVYHIDINAKREVLEVAQKEHIDGISMVCSDFGLETIGYICDNMGLSGLSEMAAVSSANKLQMKTLLRDHNVSTAKFIIIKNQDDLVQTEQILSFPVIMKAVDLQGSKGIYICKSKEDLLDSYLKITSLSKEKYCIVEEFIEGSEFGAQAFIYDNEIFFIQLHGDLITKVGHTNIPIGHYMPYNAGSETFENRAKDIIRRSIKALNLNNCAVNVDLIVKDGIPYVIELTGRAGANFLPEVTSKYLGMDYYTLILYGALNENPKNYFLSRKPKAKFILSKQLYSLKSGIIESISIPQSSNIETCLMFVKEGQTVNYFSNSSDCIGKVMCSGDDFEDCKKKIDNFINKELSLIIK